MSNSVQVHGQNSRFCGTSYHLSSLIHLSLSFANGLTLFIWMLNIQYFFFIFALSVGKQRANLTSSGYSNSPTSKAIICLQDRPWTKSWNPVFESPHKKCFYFLKVKCLKNKFKKQIIYNLVIVRTFSIKPMPTVCSSHNCLLLSQLNINLK